MNVKTYMEIEQVRIDHSPGAERRSFFEGYRAAESNLGDPEPVEIKRWHLAVLMAFGFGVLLLATFGLICAIHLALTRI